MTETWRSQPDRAVLGLLRLRDLGARLEARRPALLIAAPVLLGVGIALYFALPVEPPVLVAWLAGGAVVPWLALSRWPWAFVLAAVLALPALGFATAVLRAHTVAAPVLAAPVTALVEGRVRRVSQSASGLPRLLLDQVVIYGQSAKDTPAGIRVTMRRAPEAPLALVGRRISVMASLVPPSGPVAPGAFDFRRLAWFDGLGAVGTSRGALAVLSSEPSPDLWLARQRAAVSAHLRSRIGGDAGAFAAAIVTGDRSSLPIAAVEHLRVAGLAHLLAISGLHMAIVGGLAFGVFRFVLAAVPAIALRWPIKRWAAIGALLAALAYLLLSGGAVATQRAFIMAAVALGGVLVDRPAVSLRGLCVAACVIMLAAPESVLSAGFQMSFAATLALVAAYAEARRRGWLMPGAGLWQKWLRYAVGLVATSAIAGLATAPFAAFHFGRLAPLGLLANLAAVPVMGFWVAPMLLLGGILDLVGAGAWPLAFAGIGIETILVVAEAVAGLPGAQRVIAAAPHWILALITLGGLWFCLRTHRDRWLGAAVLSMGLVLWPQGGDEAERLLISRNARTVALRGIDGLVPEHDRRDTYTIERWLRRDGDTATVAEAARRSGWQREGVWLTGMLKPGHAVALTRAPRVYASEMALHCRRGGLLVAPRALIADPQPCLTLDRRDLTQSPAMAVRLVSASLAIEHAAGRRRLWQQPGRGRRAASQ